MAKHCFLLFITFTLVASVFAANKFAPIRHTKAGQFRGYVHTFGHRDSYVYEGIRYGRAERFEAPVAEKPHEGVYDANRFQFACPQSEIPFSEKLGHAKGIETNVANEDCLFLNVFTPADNRTKRPVMFWIYGGAFITGTIFNKLYDGSILALEGDVIFVSVNYRLGPFGFLYGGGDKYPGNLGLMDQVLGLKWVQENIEAFGGDPNQVTVFGESAGAMSIGNLILAPAAKGLFHRAILQSGSPNSYLGSQERSKIELKTRNLGEQFDCDNSTLATITECLKKRTVNELLQAAGSALQNGEVFIPTWDTPFLPHNPWHAIKEGHFNPVDVIQGINRDEGSIFVVKFFPNLEPQAKTNFTKAQTIVFVKFLMSIFFPEHHEITVEVADFYANRYDKLDSPNKFKLAISDVFGDFHLTCPSMLFIQLMAKKKPEGHYYAYHLNKQSVLPLLGCHDWMGVCHAQDLVYVFGIPHRLRGAVLDEDDYNLSTQIIKAWTTFAHTGHPGNMGDKQIEWTEAIDTKGNDPSASLMNLSPTDYRMMPHFYQDICNKFWQPKIEE